MAPRGRRTSRSGYRGVRERPNGTFYAEIRSGEERISLGTYEAADQAARAYDAAAWRLGRPRSRLNFPNEARNAAHAQELAPPPPATAEARARQREQERALLRAEIAERERLDWARRFPEDVAAMEAFYAERAEKKAARIAEKKEEREARRAVAEAKRRRNEEGERRWRMREAAKRASGAGPSTIVLDPSSDDYSWSDTPVSSTTTDSSDFDWDSDE